MKKRGNIALIMLLAYLFVLAAATIPHHHHLIEYFCLNTAVSAEHQSHEFEADCCANDTDNSCTDKGSNQCDDSGCISKNVHVASKSQNLRFFVESIQPIIAVAAAVFNTCQHNDNLSCISTYRCYIVPKINDTYVSGGLSLRAPPTAA